MNIAQIKDALQAGASVDWSAALTAVESGDIDGEFKTADEVLAVIAVFFPQAELVRELMALSVVIYDAYRSGYIKAARVEDPSMLRVTGSKAR